MRCLLLFLLVFASLILSAQDDVLWRNVFGVNTKPACDTLPLKKTGCTEKDCKPKLQVGFARGIKSVQTYYRPDSLNAFPLVEDYYYHSVDSAKLTFNRLYFYAEAFNVKQVTAKTPLVTELQIAVFYRQRNLVRVIRLADAETAKAEKICRVLDATDGTFYIAANFKPQRFLKVKGE